MTVAGVPTVEGTALRVYPLYCGFEVADSGVAMRGHEGQLESSPIGVFAVDTGDGVVLVDSGANEEIVWNPDECPRYYYPFRHPVILPEDTVLARLAAVDIAPRDVSHVVISHMHSDHSGGIRRFPDARIVIQRPEYDYAFAMARQGTTRGFFLTDWDLPTTQWEIVEGDVQLAPGVLAFATYGHTPGSQSVLVKLEQTGAFLVPGDAGATVRNFDEEILPGGATDLDAAMASIKRINEIRRQTGALLFPGHDLDAWKRLKRSPDYYD
jgi:N-acyl homoserine lactone hydrolase